MTIANRMPGWRRGFGLVLSTGLMLGIAEAPAAQAETARPLVVEGRKTVFQRVLTRPGALRYEAPDGGVAGRYAAFQPLYVYDVQPGWMRVGPSISAGPEGWVQTGAVVSWKQNIVAAFTNAAGRKRQILFGSEDKLRGLMEHEALRQMQDTLLQEIASDNIPEERGIVAAEPEEFVNIVERLYLMPILDFTVDLHPLNYEDNLLMKVASVPLNDEETPSIISDNFDAGIVFVFDTTQSMEPYIQRTQAAVQNIVESIKGTEIGDRVQFGVVAFRDNTEAAPGLEYRTKTLLPLRRRQDQTQVVATIRAATRVATVNSPGFNEDSLAGVQDAILKSDWEPEGSNDPFDARIVVLITDAGPKDVRDTDARSTIGPDQLRHVAQDKDVVVMTLHLQTPAGGAAQHAWAKSQYQQLSRFHNDSYYYGIADGSPQAFEDTVTRLVTSMTDIIRVARNQDPVQSPEETGEEIVNLGLAMRLSYLGKLKGTQAPDVIQGWVSEKAIEDPTRLAIEPRLLVTKNEMATMAELLNNLSTLGEQMRDGQDAASFFSQVRTVVAQMAQNPDRLVNTDSETLGGTLEFLEDLPYNSQLLLTTEQYWQSSAMNRRSILDGMRQKLAQYRKWLLDPTVWTPLYEGAPDGDYVFAMPFDVLP